MTTDGHKNDVGYARDLTLTLTSLLDGRPVAHSFPELLSGTRTRNECASAAPARPYILLSGVNEETLCTAGADGGEFLSRVALQADAHTIMIYNAQYVQLSW